MSDHTEVQRVAAYGVAIDEGRILLVGASATSHFAGAWSLPGGGVDHGEHPADTVAREFGEETGLAVRIDGPCAVFSDVVAIPSKTQRLHSVRLCYPVSVVGGSLRDERDGSTDLARWVHLGEAARLPAIAPFVTAAIERA